MPKSPSWMLPRLVRNKFPQRRVWGWIKNGLIKMWYPKIGGGKKQVSIKPGLKSVVPQVFNFDTYLFDFFWCFQPWWVLSEDRLPHGTNLNLTGDHHSQFPSSSIFWHCHNFGYTGIHHPGGISNEEEKKQLLDSFSIPKQGFPAEQKKSICGSWNNNSTGKWNP